MEFVISDIYDGNSWKFTCDRNLWNLLVGFMEVEC